MAYKSSYTKEFIKQNPVVSIVGGTLIVFLGYRLIRKIARGGNVIPIVPPIIPPSPTPVEPEQKKYTYLAQQYADYADKLFAAMDGSIWTLSAGTDTKSIANVCKAMKTKADVLALIDAYGKRALTTPYGWDTEPMSLSESFSYEMDDAEINSVVNQNLKQTGYRF